MRNVAACSATYGAFLLGLGLGGGHEWLAVVGIPFYAFGALWFIGTTPP